MSKTKEKLSGYHLFFVWKYISIVLLLLFLKHTICNAQNSSQMSYNINNSSDQELEAIKMLYEEINYYRGVNGKLPCTVSSTPVTYACRWNAYMVGKHVDENNNFYFHASKGPTEYHIPVTTSEIIHLLYFGHKPSNVEIVSGLMYGVYRTNPVQGWTQSTSHNEAILQKEAKYMGASITVIKQNQWYCVYSTVIFSTIP